MTRAVLRWIDRHVFRAWQCAVCGCTDHVACRGGCAWSLHGWLAGRHLCTSCEDPNGRLALLDNT